jgi:hypothetical protein
MADELARWAAERAPSLLSRAEAEAVVVLRDALVEAALRGPRKPRPAKQASAPVTGDALWAYCVTRASDPSPEGITGVAGSDLRRIDSGELVALVSRVPLAEFGEEPLRSNLNDLSWLEGVARSHEAVLEAALAECTLVPLRICTIYESEESLRRMLREEREAFGEALEALDGRQEWGVKLLVDRERLEEAAGSRSDEGGTVADELGASGGGAYMLRRRREREVREAADALAQEVAEGVHARLEDWATAAVTRPPQNRDLSGHEGDMLLNAAYLVELDRVDGLRGLVAELQELHRPLGASLELTGPWPPYNFVPRGGAAAIA